MLVFYLPFFPFFNTFFECNRFLVKLEKKNTGFVICIPNVLNFESHPKLVFLTILRVLNLKPIIQNS